MNLNWSNVNRGRGRDLQSSWTFNMYLPHYRRSLSWYLALQTWLSPATRLGVQLSPCRGPHHSYCTVWMHFCFWRSINFLLVVPLSVPPHIWISTEKKSCHTVNIRHPITYCGVDSTSIQSQQVSSQLLQRKLH